MYLYRAAGVLMFVMGLACYKGVIVAAVAQFLQLGSWASLLQVPVHNSSDTAVTAGPQPPTVT